MFSRALLSVIIVTSAFTLVFGQETPEAKKDAERNARTFAFAFDGGGSYLGVQTQEVNKDNFAKYGLRDVRGVAIDKVVDNSPAAAAGLRTGDVIVRFNGEDVTGSRKLTRLVGEVDPDHQARITVVRDGKEKEFTATLAKRPEPALANGSFNVGKLDIPELKDLPALKNFPGGDAPEVFDVPGGEGRVFTFHTGGRQIGIGSTPLSKQLAAHFGVDSGVMVNEVREGSPAEKAGLKAGDIIVDADGTAIKGTFDLVKAINDKKEGNVTLTYVRDGVRQTVIVTPEAAKDNNMFFNGDGGGFTPATPAAPGTFKMTRPMTPPMPAMAPMTWYGPHRVI
jgi:serine protease Do